MLTARTDLITHLATLPALSGVATIKPYAGEIAQAVQAGGVLTVALPAAFVLASGYEATASANITRLDVLLVTHTAALDVQGESGDVLALAEGLVDTLRADVDWTAGGRRYIVRLGDGLRADTLAVAADYSIARVSLTVEAR